MDILTYEEQYENELIKQRSPRFAAGIFYGMIFGSIATFLLDPTKGRRRRALLRDKGVHFKKISQGFLSQKLMHFKSIIQGKAEREDGYIRPCDF